MSESNEVIHLSGGRTKGRYIPNQRGKIPTLKQFHPESLEKEDLVPGRRYKLRFNESLVEATLIDTFVRHEVQHGCRALVFEHCEFHMIGVDAAVITEVD